MTMFCPPSSETRNSAKRGERGRETERKACLFFFYCELKLMFITKCLDKSCIVHLCLSLLNKPDKPGLYPTNMILTLF